MYSTAKDFIRSLPTDIRNDLNALWNVPQNPVWHPEGNTYKHTFLCINRAVGLTTYDGHPITNRLLIIAALFHDMGKTDVLKFTDTGKPTAHGHEKASCFYIFKYRRWIKSQNVDPMDVMWITRNHMRAKKLSEMRRSKVLRLSVHRRFVDLITFRYEIDKGGW